MTVLVILIILSVKTIFRLSHCRPKSISHRIYCYSQVDMELVNHSIEHAHRDSVFDPPSLDEDTAWERWTKIFLVDLTC